MKKLLFLLLLLSSSSLFAQQDAMFTQYMFNTLAVNPAYAGNRETLSITGLHRSQWYGTPGAPTTNTLTIDSNVPNRNIGLGANIVYDVVGVNRNFTFNGYYAYKIKFSNDRVLSFGIQAGISQYSADFSGIKHAQFDDVHDVLFTENINKWMPNFGAGIFFHGKKYYVGISSPKMLRNSLTASNSVVTSRQLSHYFMMAGYVFDLSRDVKLKPSVLVKYVTGSPVEADLNAMVWFYDRLSIGGTYRTGDSVDAMAELQITPRWTLGYAHDFTFTRLSSRVGSTHELMIRYETVLTKTKIISPRYF